MPPDAPAREPSPARPARPRWLVVALLVALLFGVGSWTEGCERLVVYRGEREILTQQNAEVPEGAPRQRAEALFDHFIEVAEREKGKTVPFAVGSFVLGAALLALAARGLTGRTNPRSAIIQVVLVQALVHGAAYFATHDYREAENEWKLELSLYKWHLVPPDQLDQARAVNRAMLHVLDPTWLVVRTIASGLVVFALTRQRAREFFDAAQQQVPES